MKNGFFDSITVLIKWFASIFEDKRGAASSKRIGFFIILWIFRDGLKSGWINNEMIWPFIVLVLIAGAWSLPEWFVKFKPGSDENG